MVAELCSPSPWNRVDGRLVAARGLTCLTELAAGHPDGRLLVVCHGTLIRVMLCSMLDLPLGAYRRLLPVVRNGHLNEVRLGADGRAALLSWNALPVPVGAAVG